MYSLIPGQPIAYWASQQLCSSFKIGKRLDDNFVIRNGLKTGDNEKYVRLWHEVSIISEDLYCTDYIVAIYGGKKWFPINKGGDFRKWYGNDEYVVNWQNKGFDIIQKAKIEHRNVQDYPDAYKFIPIITWSKITSYKPSFRYKKYAISETCGLSIYLDEGHIPYVLAFVNTPIIISVLQLLNPTLNYQCGDVGRLPIVYSEKWKEQIENLAETNIKNSKDDWDSFEQSWDFKKHPLI